MAEQVPKTIDKRLDEQPCEEGAEEIRKLAEQLIGASPSSVAEHLLPNRRPELIQAYLLGRPVGDMILDPDGPIRKYPGIYEPIPWQAYATLGDTNIKQVTVGASEVRETSGRQSDWRHAVFIRFYWKDDSGEVRETISIEAYASKPEGMPIVGSQVDIRTNSDEDFTLWRSESRAAVTTDEALLLLGVVKKLYNAEHVLVDRTLEGSDWTEDAGYDEAHNGT